MLTAKQREYLCNCNKRWNIKGGAVRSGKTFLDYSVVIPQRIMRIHGPGAIVIMGHSRGSIEKNVLGPMRELYGENLVGTIGGTESRAMLFGQKVYCSGMGDATGVDRIKGMSIKYAYGDEVDSWSEQSFNMLKTRLDKPYSKFDGTYNPRSPNHWLKQFLDTATNIYHQHYTLWDNCTLDPDVAQAIADEQTGVYYDRYIKGLWTLAEGLIFDMFQRERHIVSSKERYYSEFVVGIDYGTYNPCVFVLLGRELERKRWVVVKEYYYNGREQPQKTDKQYADDFLQWIGDIPYKAIYVDPSAASFITELRQRGLVVKSAKNDVLPGINAVRNMLQKMQLVIQHNCTNTLNEVQEYVWDTQAGEKGNDAPLKNNDHCMDAIRYPVYSYIYKHEERRNDTKSDKGNIQDRIMAKYREKYTRTMAPGVQGGISLDPGKPYGNKKS
ncbi:MAG: PBSX family phage terminase large subunit [Tissierellia bacterium]|nr:PBSX family phage terminase large subunit [Tissierellia bacterium]